MGNKFRFIEFDGPILIECYSLYVTEVVICLTVTLWYDCSDVGTHFK